MRNNQPVSGIERPLREDQSIISRTDLKGTITYVNQQFIDISGFSEQELIGAPHNLVRHPDMPPEAFADMWNTLKAGGSWTGVVKNRCKNGDHYWVLANATPIREQGRVVGYTSVRTRPSREQVAAAEAVYARFQAGKARGWRISNGKAVRTGIGGMRAFFRDMGIQRRLVLAIGLLCVLLAAVGALGLHGIDAAESFLRQSDAVLRADPAPAMNTAASPGAAAGRTLIERERQGVARASATLQSDLRLMYRTMLALVVLGVLLAAAMGWLLVRAIVQPLEHAVDVAKQIAAGNLTASIRTGGAGETGQLLHALTVMKTSLASIIAGVRSNAEAIDTASGEIAAGNADLSRRTEAQAASLEETASSMEELSSTVRQNADHSAQARQLVHGTRDVAVDGGAAMDRVVNTMDRIAEGSRRITDIIGVIDGIAFQTNILALNAAVEAARAGTAGRGFAVVASEVRTLAQRSAAAAKEIKTLIHDSVAQVESGAHQVAQARGKMEEIVGAVQKVADIMTDIAGASAEQSTGIEQVREAVVQMDSVTQQNAALVEEAAAAAESLRAQGRALVQCIGVFTLAPQPATTPRQGMAAVRQLGARAASTRGGRAVMTGT